MVLGVAVDRIDELGHHLEHARVGVADLADLGLLEIVERADDVGGEHEEEPPGAEVEPAQVGGRLIALERAAPHVGDREDDRAREQR